MTVYVNVHRICAVFLLVQVVGCFHGRPAIPENYATSATTAMLVARAERALAESQKPDLRRPFLAYDPGRVRDLYIDACRNGDGGSCSIAITVAKRSIPDSLLALVYERCRAHDLMSCRALPWDRTYPHDRAPGSVGRSAACREGAVTCDREQLRRECAQGLPLSCSALVDLDPGLPAGEWADERGKALAREGCRTGIGAECRVLLSDRAAGGFAATRLCELAREQCVASEHPSPQEAFERACQYGDESAWACAELGLRYLRGEFPEPVKGRGQALLDWACTAPDLRRVTECNVPSD
jgi:hypothetical protein